MLGLPVAVVGPPLKTLQYVLPVLWMTSYFLFSFRLSATGFIIPVKNIIIMSQIQIQVCSL